MAVLVFMWAIAGYGLLAAILLTTGYDTVRGKYLLAGVGLAASIFSPLPFSYVLDSLGFASNTEIFMVTSTVFGIISAIFISYLLRQTIRTDKTLALCSIALSVLLIAIGCFLAVLISPKKQWAPALPEILAVLFPPVMIGGVPFIFHRALRRFMLLREA